MPDGIAPETWRKSSHSNYQGCVEVRFLAGGVEVRNSRDPHGPVLRFTPFEWDVFLAGARGDEFDLPRQRAS
ncbi:hypothetical protein GCM10009836_65870 [Pseudonocardia ailaonensis]|uniref:DUF397 domain-containing protein n=1 Tax=Pseudonocardia ailaonensis TaxID=367279 RepID=A0ABN2NQ85_9PSEU